VADVILIIIDAWSLSALLYNTIQYTQHWQYGDTYNLMNVFLSFEHLSAWKYVLRCKKRKKDWTAQHFTTLHSKLIITDDQPTN